VEIVAHLRPRAGGAQQAGTPSAVDAGRAMTTRFVALGRSHRAADEADRAAGDETGSIFISSPTRGPPRRHHCAACSAPPDRSVSG
jgi:hypothetical protein